MSRRKLALPVKAQGLSLSVELVEGLRHYSDYRSQEESRHVSMSRIVEEACREYLGMAPFPTPEREQC